MKGRTFKRCSCGTVTDSSGRVIPCRRKHGSWFFVYDGPPADSGRRRQIRVGGFSTEREARAAMTASLAAFGGGEPVMPSRATVSAYLEEWLAGKGGLRSTTRRSYGEHIRLYLAPGLGHLRLAALTDADVDRLFMAMRELGPSTDPGPGSTTRRLLAARAPGHGVHPLSPATIRRVHATLMSALNTAVKRKLIPANPARHLELAPARRPRAVVWTPERVAQWKRDGLAPPVAVWTAEQTGTFLDAARSDRLYPLFHLIAYRGLRRGEAVGLRWVDVDLERGALRVTQQVVQLGWATEIGPPKTGSGERTISLDEKTVAVLRRWSVLQVRHREGWASGWVDSGLVFTRENGGPLHPDLATDAFARLARRAGLPPIRLHDLRHTAASLALQAGVPMKVVSEQLGHSSLAITADTYTSVLPAVARAAAEAVSRIIPRRGPGQPAVRGACNPFPFRSHPAQKGAEIGPSQNSDRTKPQVRRGAPPGTRTPNPLIKSQLLCQLS